MTHDFRRDGSRTVWRRTLGPLHAWLEERASYHLAGSTHYGVGTHKWDDLEPTQLELQAGRWSLHIMRKRTPEQAADDDMWRRHKQLAAEREAFERTQR